MAGLGNLEVQARPVREPAAAGAPVPRVLYAVAIAPGHKFGSIEDQILTLAARFQAEGSLFLPLFLNAPVADGLAFFHSQGVLAEALELRRFRWGTLRRLLRLLREHRIDAIHWNFTSPLGNAYLWWLTLLRPGLRHYFTDHISRFVPLPPPRRGPRAWLKRLLLKRYAKVFGISDFVVGCLRAQGVWPAGVACCRYFINTDRFRPDAAARSRLRREQSAEGRFVILVAAQLIQDKGIDVLIRAMADLPAEAVLWVIGEGPARAALDAQIAQQGLTERVRMLGHRFDVAPFMQAADCFVCPSRWAEAVGLVNLEAAACGLPVVASRIGGIPEHVTDGRTGLLFTPGDAAALAGCLGRLLGDRTLTRRLGEQARAQAVERFSIDARLSEVLELYRG
jgi:glycosyltransferase involved in cell wall biosynthesis